MFWNSHDNHLGLLCTMCACEISSGNYVETLNIAQKHEHRLDNKSFTHH